MSTSTVTAAKGRPRLLRPGVAFRGYVIERGLGVGGVGEVWLARHMVLRTAFAIKVISPKVFAADQEAKTRFYREARIAARIRHPSLVAVYDAGRDETTGLYFLVMDYLPGGTVADKIARLRKLSVRYALGIARTVAEGLVELKRNGIVHRDVKPSNMLFASDGSVKLSDPGIAREQMSDEKTLTQTGFALGTPLYMPYEQIMDSHAVDSRADVFALGVSMFEMLAGTCPGASLSSTEIFRRRMNGECLPDVRTVNKAIPEGVAALVGQMTEPDVQKRVAGPQQVLERLDACMDRPAASVKGETGIGVRWVAAAAVGGAALVAAIVGSALYDGMLEVKTAEAPPPAEFRREPYAVSQAPAPVPETVTEVVTEVVTQVVEKVEVREVERYVVVTNTVHVERPVENAAPPPAELPADAHPTMAGDRPQETSSCGIVIECDRGRARELDGLREMVRTADAAVRRFMSLPRGVRTQDDVRRIVLSDNFVGDGFRREGKTLWIGAALASDKDRLAMLVADFMTACRDVAVEPFGSDEICRYVELRVYDELRPGAGKRKIEAAIKQTQDLKRRYGECDYNGQRTKHKTKHQHVPLALVATYRRGSLFELLKLAEKETGGAALGRYFTEKRNALERNRIGTAMSASDFAAVLSLACGENFFPYLKSCMWDVDELATRLKVGHMKNAEFFGFGR